jgi:hypothetical protein
MGVARCKPATHLVDGIANLPKGGNRLVVTAGSEAGDASIPWRPLDIEGIQPLAQVDLLDASIRISRGSEEQSVVASRRGIVRVQIDGLFGFRSRFVILPSKYVNKSEYAAREAVGLIEQDGALRQFVSLGERTLAICLQHAM